MTISDKKFNETVSQINAKLDKLLDRHDKLNERVSKLEGRNEGSSERNQRPLLIVAVTLLGGAFVTYQAWLGMQIVRLNAEVAVLMAPQKLQAAASNPTNPNNIEQVNKILQNARERNQIIDPPLLANVGARFIAVSQNSPEAWQAAISLLDYRSFLNPDFTPAVSQLRQWKNTDTYTMALM